MQKEFSVAKSTLIFNYSCLIIFCFILLLLIITSHVIFKIVLSIIIILLLFDYLTMPYKAIVTQDNNIVFKSVISSKIVDPSKVIKIYKRNKSSKTIYIRCTKYTLKMFKQIDKFNELFEFIASLNPELQNSNL